MRIFMLINFLLGGLVASFLILYLIIGYMCVTLNGLSDGSFSNKYSAWVIFIAWPFILLESYIKNEKNN